MSVYRLVFVLFGVCSSVYFGIEFPVLRLDLDVLSFSCDTLENDGRTAKIVVFG